MVMKKWVYEFSANSAEGRADMYDMLGGKGANLAEMSNINLPVPPGLTISTEACCYYYNNSAEFPVNLKQQLSESIRKLEQITGKKFGCADNPLLFSVRSGAKISMPGMLDTVLNLGLNEQSVKGLAANSGNERFALDSYRRFIQMYADVVLGISAGYFEDILESHKNAKSIEEDLDLSEEDLRQIISEFKDRIKAFGKEIPADPVQQLYQAIEAVFKSWMSDRAITYRELNNISSDIGTAVNIQTMVFGNMGNSSATGVLFTRNPSTGERELYGEFLVNAQGEDVVAGIRTPAPIASKGKGDSMEETIPELFSQLVSVQNILEQHYKDMQDIEFTVENGKLYILQTRSGKRTAMAAIKIAVDMVSEGLLSRESAILNINPESLNQLLHARIDSQSKVNIVANGLPASPGAASGIVVFSSDEAEELAHNQKVILVRNDTTPEDIKGMHVSEGILTARGGMTSHAAVVARGMGTPCVCGVSSIKVSEKAREVIFENGQVIRAGEYITIDGSNGNVLKGQVSLSKPELPDDFYQVMSWAEEISQMQVRANAETANDIKNALEFGAAGIGLCRTEHMFFEERRLQLIRQMIIQEGAEEKLRAINNLLPLHKADFAELFKILEGKPINIRLLDPPLHEFLPHNEEEIEDLAKGLEVPYSSLKHRVANLRETNPMLGHRGCRLGITSPEIYKMQLDAIFGAALEVQQSGMNVNFEIMLPLIATERELEILVNLVTKVKAEYQEIKSYQIGTMIELPRAALQARKLARHVDYFSFGTNDLTQTSFGISRDDISSFLPSYFEQGIFHYDPFTRIDEDGVGELIEIASERGRETNPSIKLGICGEHAANPETIDFCARVGMDYVSCSPYRIPIAKLAVAQAGLKK